MIMNHKNARTIIIIIILCNWNYQKNKKTKQSILCISYSVDVSV